MALFKNLYLDLSYLNPFSYFKKDSNQNNIDDNSQTNSKNIENTDVYNTNIYPPDLMINKDIQTMNSTNKETDIFNQTENLELPDISKEVLDEKSYQVFNEINEKQTNNEKTADNNLKNLNLKNNDYDFYEKLPDLKLSELNLVMPPASIETYKEKKIKSENTEIENKKILKKELSNTEIENSKIENTEAYSENKILKNKQNNNFQNFSSSYFKEIENKIINDSRINNLTNKIYNPNLLEEMQSFWKLKKDEINQLKFNSTIKEELLKKLNELQELEIEWQNLQLQHEKISDMLFSKEILIENNQKQIKKLFKKLHLSTNVPFNNEFVLPDGKKINNLNELILNLNSMSDDFFKHHVNETKNDFYNWIKDVYGFIDLAEEIKNIKNKNEMADKIEKWASI